MKKLLVTMLLMGQIFAQNVLSQELSSTAVASQIKSTQLFYLSESLDTQLLYKKFGNIQSASVNYNRQSISLSVQGSVSCGKGMACVDLMPLPVEVNLKVTRIERRECDDIIYASTGANVKSVSFEEIRITDPNVGRCNYFQEVKGELVYRITGSLTNDRSSTNTSHSEWIKFEMNESRK